MVQTKHQKSKPKNKPQAKKHGKQADISEFRAQLDILGLKIIQVTADGNCFFRALADQLEGNEEEHEKYRSMVVQHIVKNREMFEPFIEDDVPFDGYCQSMEKDGTWAGHMELQAASLVTRSNICIHRHMSPRWYIRNFDQGGHMIHLSYHDGEHYNSVRSKEDPGDGPAKPIVIKADVNLTASSQHTKAAGAHSKSRTSKNVIHSGAVKMVMTGSGCEDATKVEQVLSEVDGDIDAAIEFLIAEQEGGETVDKSDVICEKDSNGNDEKRNFDKHEDADNFADEKDQSNNIKRVGNGKLSSKADKKIPRNKICPCGSKKKYKACCGATSGRTYSKLVDHEADSRGKKGKKQGKKVAPVSKAPTLGSDQALPDMGALCI